MGKISPVEASDHRRLSDSNFWKPSNTMVSLCKNHNWLGLGAAKPLKNHWTRWCPLKKYYHRIVSNFYHRSSLFRTHVYLKQYFFLENGLGPDILSGLEPIIPNDNIQASLTPWSTDSLLWLICSFWLNDFRTLLIETSDYREVM